MTACSNRKGRAGRVITAALVGALSVGAPAVALATGGVDLLATAQENWQNGDFEFNVEANKDGSYTVTEGDTLAFVSATDAAGTEYGASDVTVLFFDSGEGSIANGGPIDGSTLVSATNAIDGRLGGMPEDADTYWVVVFQGDVTVPEGATKFGDLTGVTNYKAFKLVVEAETTSIEGAAAYEVNQSDDSDVSDKDFAYTGGDITVGFEVGGEALDAGDYDIVWISGSATDSNGGTYTVTEAGTYKARLTGKGDYTGTVDVTFTVSAVDLSTASISISPAESFAVDSDGVLTNTLVTINGSKMAEGADMEVTLVAVNGVTYTNQELTTNGVYTFKITPTSGTSNVKNEAVVDAYVVKDVVTYSYNGEGLTSGETELGFDASKGSVFTTAAISADPDVDFTVTVTRDGEEVTDYSEPGTYKVVLDTPVEKGSDGTYLYAGHCEFTFTVAGEDYSGSKVYASYDGKFLADDAVIDYTGKAIEPTVVVKDAKGNVLTEGEDYTWKLVDADGNEVESATAVGSYAIEVEYNGKDTDAETEVSFTIAKATILSAAATADYFAIPSDGSAATPTFYGYTKEGCEGTEFELAADDISVKYYKAVADDEGGITYDGKTYTKGDAVKAEDLTADGLYVADINVLTTADSLSGSGLTTVFRLTKTAVYTDVDANAWYGGVVYEAKSLGYMSGIGGTSLFMPTATISRAEVAGVMFNMAGGEDDEASHPTRFSDVPEDSWFAQAVDWASTTGVMGGYTGTDAFGSYDATTREQVAAILYNYAKAQGMDVSVEDADAALAAFDDADEVSAWARTAVAWAVENGIMGNGGYIGAKSTITRAEMAAMAVNFQPEKLDEPWA